MPAVVPADVPGLPGLPALPAPRRPSGPYRVCLVCLGNICRSPMAEVMLRAELDRAGLAGLVEVDSAGTGDWHLGEPMAEQAGEELARRGYDGSAHRARRIQRSWFGERDLVLAMDLSNLAALRVLAPDAEAAGPRLMLFRSFDPDLAGGVLGDPWDGAVPDPYGGPQTAFAQSLDLVQAAVQGLVGRLAQLLGTETGTPDGVTPGGAAPDGRAPERAAGDEARPGRAAGRRGQAGPGMSGPAGPGAGEPAPEGPGAEEPGAGEPVPPPRRPKLARRVPELARRLARITGAEVREIRPAGSQHQWAHYQVTLADGRLVFAKAARQDLGSVFEAEARGLRWLADAHAVPLPEVLGWDTATLAVTWLPQQAPDQHAAEQFGRDLAVLHASGAERFGTPWPGFIATLPLGDRSGDTVTVAAEATLPGPVTAGAAAASPAMLVSGAGDWASWYASKRLLPYLRRAAGTGVLTGSDTRLVEDVVSRIATLAGPPEPPRRIHGDCWSGNVLWSGGRGWLIDPAAQGGHRETDLAMLALFGAPHLDRILAAYQEVAPLAEGWRSRVPLHQLHPLLVHACLFGRSYRESVLAAARAALAAG